MAPFWNQFTNIVSDVKNSEVFKTAVDMGTKGITFVNLATLMGSSLATSDNSIEVPRIVSEPLKSYSKYEKVKQEKTDAENNHENETATLARQPLASGSPPPEDEDEHFDSGFYPGSSLPEDINPEYKVEALSPSSLDSKFPSAEIELSFDSVEEVSSGDFSTIPLDDSSCDTTGNDTADDNATGDDSSGDTSGDSSDNT
jgi:hypothetical protein